MLKKLRRGIGAKRARRSSAQPLVRKIRFEPLESRFLLSADIAIPPPDPSQDGIDGQDITQTQLTQPLVIEEQQQVQILEPESYVGDPDAEAASGKTVEAEVEDAEASNDASAENTDAAGAQHTETGEAVEESQDSADDGADAGDQSSASNEDSDTTENSRADDGASGTIADGSGLPPQGDVSPQDAIPSAAASQLERHPREIVFVDPDVKDYQDLLDDLLHPSHQQIQTEGQDSVPGDAGGGIDEIIDYGQVPDDSEETDLLSLPDDFDVDARFYDKEKDIDASFVEDDTLVVVLDAGRDGIDQISEVLQAYEGVAAVHILSHGGNANIRLGGANLNNTTLKQYSERLKAWGRALSPEGDILLYGCDVANGRTGVKLVQDLGDLTGADVAASNDDTGSEMLGGDWQLEVSTGVIETLPLFGPIGPEAYPYLLADYAIAGTVDGDIFTINADSVQRGIDAPTIFTTGDNVAVNATNIADTAGTPGSDVFDVQAFPTAQQADPASGSLALYGGEDTDSLDLSALTADLTFTFDSSGEVLVSDGVYVLVAVDIEEIIAGTGSNSFVFTPGAVYSGAITGSGDDTFDFTAYDGLLTFSGDNIRNADSSLDLAHSGIENINVNLDQVNITDATDALTDGLSDLVGWADDLQEEGAIGRTLAGLGANVGVTLGNSIGIAESMEQLRLEIEALVDDAQAAGEDVLAQDIQDLLDGFNQTEIQYADRAVVGDVFDPAISGADSFGFDLELREGDTTTSASITVAGNMDLSVFVENINSAINADSDLRGKVRAIEVTQNDGGTPKTRIGFQVVSADIDEFTLAQSPGSLTEISRLGFAATRTISGLQDEIQDLDVLKVTTAGVTAELTFVGGLPELVFDFGYTAERSSEFNIDLGKGAEDLGLTFDASETIGVTSALNAGLGLGLSLNADADFFFNLDDLAVSAESGSLAIDSDIKIGFLAASASGSAQLQADVVSAAALDHEDPADGNMPALGAGAQDFFDLDLTVAVDEGRVSGLETFNEPGSELSIAVTGGDPLEGRDLDITYGNFDNLGRFGEFNAASFVSQVGSVRDWFASVRDSDIFKSVDIPFVTPALDSVFDLADAVGDTLLYDDADDGEDGDATLVVDLRAALAEADLEDKLRVEGDGSRISFSAKDSSISFIDVTGGAAIGFDGTEVFDNGTLTGSADATPVLGANATFRIRLVENGQPKDYDVTLTATATENNETVGNDHARLLDENDAPTFETTQELADRLFEIIGIEENVTAAYDTDSKRLTFALTFDSSYELGVPVDFDFDLSPIGNIGTAGSPDITLGAGIDLSLTLGLDLSDQPPGTKDLTADTPLTELSSIDDLAEAIKTEFALSPAQAPAAKLSNADQVEIAFIDSGAEMTGSPKLTFTDNGDADTITRSGGNWLADGFRADQQITITGTGSNNGSFTITAVSGDGLTLLLADGNELQDEVKSGAEVTGAAPTLTESPELSFTSAGTITRSEGSWSDDGFQNDNYIVIEGGGANNGVYRIADIVSTTLILKDSAGNAASFAAKTDVKNVTITVPDRIRLEAGGNWAADGFRAGQLISVSGTQSNNRTFLIADVVEGGEVLMLSAGAKAANETLNEDTDLRVSGGAVVRLSENATFRIDGVSVTVLAQPGGEVSFVSDTSDNNNLLDLANDINSALDEAGLGNRIQAELSNGKLLLTARTELAGNPVLDFSPATNTISRDEGSWLDDGFAVGQIIRLSGSSSNDGIAYTIADIDAAVLTLSPAEVLNAEVASRDIVVTGTSDFTLITTPGDTAATEIGFAPSQDADSADLLITVSDTGFDPYRVTLDGATTVQDVIDAIESQTFGNVRADVDPDSEAGLRLRQVPALTGNPRLTFEATGNAILREDGRPWSDDQFSVGQTIRVSGADEDNDGVYEITNITDIGGRDALIVTKISGGTLAVDQQSVKDIRITLNGDEIFRVEAVNGSKAAARLGILKADVGTDVDNNGKVEVADSDGIIIGDPLAGASLLDRFFIKEPTVEGRLFIDARDDESTARVNDGMVVAGDFGFVSVNLIGSGAFETRLTLGLDDPTPAIEGITVNELIGSLSYLGSIVATPTIGGAKISGESLQFDGKTIVRTNNELWVDDDFSIGEYISVSGAAEQNNGKFRIANIEGSRLTVEAEGDFSPGTVTTATVLDEIGAFELMLDVDPDFGLIGDDAASLAVALFDFGNPFADTGFTQGQFTVGEDEDSFTLTGDWTDRIRPGAGVVAELAAVTFDDATKLTESSFTVSGDQRGKFALGARVTAELADASDVISKIRSINYSEITDATTFIIEDDVLTDDLLKASIASKDTLTVVLTTSYDADADQTTVTVVGDVLTDDVSNVTVDTPRELNYLLELPDLGDLVKFDQIDIGQIIDGLIELSDFLGDFEAFGFLSDPIPVINVSINDVLAFADRFDAAVQEAQNNPAGTLQVLEGKLKEALGVPSGIDSDALGFFERQSSDTGILRGEAITDAQVADMTRDAVFLLSLDNGPSQLIKVATADAGTVDELVVNVNTALSAAFATNVQARRTVDSEIEFFTTDDRPLAISNPIDLSIYEEGDLELFRMDFGVGIGFTEALDVDFDLGDVGVLSGSAGLQASGAVDFALGLGIDLNNPSDVYLFDSSITGQLEAIGDDLAFRAGIGPLGVFVNDGVVSVGGDIGNKLFSLGLDFDGDNATRDGRKLISDVVLEDDFSAELSGSITADLPVYFPAETLHKGSVTFQAGLSVDESGNLETASELGALDPEGGTTRADGSEFTIDDLFDIDLSELTLMDNMLLAVDGLDSFLGGLQDVLDGEVFGVPLPLVGDKLSDGARFIEDFRDDFIDPFRDEIENLAVQDENIVSELLFDLLGPGGISLLLDGNDDGAVTIDDIILDTNIDEADGDLQNDYMQWNMELGQELQLGSGIDLDLGIPGLGLETSGDVNLELGWNLGFGFGISFDEAFYLDISDDSELEVGLDVTLPDFGLAGELAFLQLDARGNKNDAGEDISHFSARFGIDVNNKNAATDERLAFSELGSIGLEPGIAGEAVVDLNFELKLNSELAPGVAGVFPKVVTDFFLDWSIDGDEGAAGLQLKPFSELKGESALNLVKGGLNLVEFQDVSLDLGSFISDFIDPVLGTVREVTEPLQPIIDFLTAPLPVISDLGPELAILDIAEMTGKVNTGFIESVADLITFVNAIPLNAETVLLNFGDFTIYDRLETPDLDITDPTEDVQSKVAVPRERTGVEETPAGGDPSGTKTKQFTDKIKAAGDFDFPIINDPTQIFNLLLGKDAVLMTYDLKPLVAEFSFKQSFPVYPPLYVAILGEIAAEADFAFGFDTAGIAEFADTGFRNPLVIFNGFYVSDTDLPTGEFGTDVPELTLSGGLGAAAELNLGIASAGVGGGVFVDVFFDLFDPSHDGKVRVPEMVNNIVNEFRYGSPALAPLALFDVSGEVFAKLFAYIEFLFFEYQFDITPPITLLEFDIPFTRVPTLATDIGDGVLQINMGEFASQRLNNDTIDDDETFVITGSGSTVNVAATFGGTTYVQTYSNVSKILALGGEGNDTIDLSGLASAGIEFELEGGVGDDRIILSNNAAGDAFIDGGIGDDAIVGGAGNDEIYGGAGNDTITGGNGRDTIFGDEGEIAYQEDESGAVLVDGLGNPLIDYTRSRVKITDGEDVIDGGAGGDRIFGGGGEDEIQGGADGDLIIGDGAILREVLRITARNDVTDFELAEDATLEIIIDGESFLVTVLAADTGGNTTIDELVGNINDQLAEDGIADRVTAGNDGERLQFRATTGVLEIRVKGANDAATSTLGFTPFFKKALVLDDVNRGDGKADTLLGGSGDDVVYGGRGDDTLHGNEDNDQLFGGEGFDLLYGDTADDRLFGGEDNDELSGGAGNDHIEGGTGHDILWGDWRTGEAVVGAAGVDSMWGDTGADTLFGGAEGDFLFGGSDPDLIFGEQGDDTIDGGHGADRIFGGVDNDSVTSSLGDDLIDGGSGSDDIVINTLGGDMRSLLTIFDSGAPIGDGVDTLIVNGTDKADRLLLRAARADIFDASLIDVNGALADIEGDLADMGVIKALQFDLSTMPPRAFIAKLNSEGNAERINYYDNMESIIVNGLGESDHIVSDNTSAEVTINGGDGDDLFQVGQLFNSPRDEDADINPYDVFDTVQTTKGFLSSGIDAPMTINGEGGGDSFVVFRNLAVLTLNGGDGDDEFLVKAFALEGSVDDPDRDLTDITGAGGADLIQYAVNAPVGINGGDGLDTVIVLGTEFGDDFVVTEQGVFGAGLNVSFSGIEILKLDTAEGNDRIFVLGTGPDHVTEVFAGEGSDAYFIGGDAPPVVSNDLLGHSGLITHEAGSRDDRFDGVNVDGIAANVGDNDEPFIRIIKDDGLLRVTEDGMAMASYSMVLTREPRGLVGITAIAPRPSPNEARNGIEYLRVNGMQAAQLVFDAANWYVPQTIEVTATPDLAYEGIHIGTINHLVTQFPVPGAPNYDNMAIPSVSVAVVDDDLPGLVIQQVGGDARAVEGAGFGAAAPFATEYTIRLNQRPDSDVTVDLVNEDGQLQLEQTRLTFTPGNWDTPQTVRVIAADDTLNEGFHYGYIEHQVSSAQADVTLGTTDTFAGTTEGSVLLDYAPIDKDAITSVEVGGEVREAGLYRLDGRQLTLIDEAGQPVAVTEEIVVSYTYIKPGFQDVARETIGVQIGDNDAPGVLVMQGGGSTNVLEVDGTTPGFELAPFADQYQVVLTARPDSAVVIDVAPQPTKTSGRPPFVFSAEAGNVAVTELGFTESSDPTISLISGNPAPEDGRLGGNLVFEIDLTPDDDTDAAVQVVLTQAETADNQSIDDLIDDINSALEEAGLGEKIFSVRDESRVVIAKVTEPQREQVSVSTSTLTFTPANWNIPQTVTVNAINDAVVDGGDIKVFAPVEQTVARIQGPLIINGGGGEGSDAGLGADPLRLPGESNDVGNVVEVPTDSEGNVLANQVVLDGDDIDKLGPTFFRSLDTFEPGDEDDDTKAKIIIRITSGPGAGQERVVVARNDNTFILAEDWNSDGLPTGESSYIFIRELGSVNEAEQVDVATVLIHESVADNKGTLSATRLYGLGMGPDIELDGLTWPGGLTYADLENLTVHMGPGDDGLEVYGSQNRTDFRTVTIVNTGAGDDRVTADIEVGGGRVASGTVTDSRSKHLQDSGADFPTEGRGLSGYLVRVTGPEGNVQERTILFNDESMLYLDDAWTRLPQPGESYEIIRHAAGLISINTQAGNDRLDASRSTAPLIAFGGLGADTLIGGEGNDILIGDRGRIDYIDGDGNVVTRLGSNDIPAPRQKNPEDPDNPTVIFRQTDGVFRAPAFIKSLEPANGGNDVLIGRGGKDLLIGGAKADNLQGDSGNDVLIGDGGQKVPLGAGREYYETIDNFIGGNDVLNGGPGNDIMFGGFGNDQFFGNFNEDVILGEYGRVTLQDGTVAFVLRLGQGSLDLAASTLFSLYGVEPYPAQAVPVPGQAAEALMAPEPVAAAEELGEGVRGEVRYPSHHAAVPEELPPPGGIPRPEHHVVAQGDTLWNLAETYLGAGWRWPEIWELNSQINNPDLIFPGMQLRLPEEPDRQEDGLGGVDDGNAVPTEGGADARSLESKPSPDSQEMHIAAASLGLLALQPQRPSRRRQYDVVSHGSPDGTFVFNEKSSALQPCYQAPNATRSAVRHFKFEDDAGGDFPAAATHAPDVGGRPVIQWEHGAHTVVRQHVGASDAGEDRWGI